MSLKQKRSRGLILFLFTVLIISNIVLFYKLNNRDIDLNYEKQNSVNLKEQIKVLRNENNLQSQSLSSSPYNINEWKTQTYNDYGISIKCPKDWGCGKGWFLIALNGKNKIGGNLGLEITKLDDNMFKHSEYKNANEWYEALITKQVKKSTTQGNRFIENAINPEEISVIDFKGKKAIFSTFNKETNVMLVHLNNEVFAFTYPQYRKDGDPLMELLLQSITFLK